MEISDVRRRIRQVSERVHERDASRTRRDAAVRDYNRFLETVAIPVFRVCVAALKAEGYQFELQTPPGVARLVSERFPDSFIELALDATEGSMLVLGRVRIRRARETTTTERPVCGEPGIAGLTEDGVLRFLLMELEPFLR